MIDLHYWTTPNGHKVTMFLEETGTPYKIFPVNIGKGEQFKADFLAISPNNRIPAMVDHDPPGGGKPISVFESGAMLVYLAEKTGKFLPNEPRKRADVKKWLDVIAARPATVRAYDIVKKVNPNHGGIRTAEERAILFGQTAESIAKAAASAG